MKKLCSLFVVVGLSVGITLSPVDSFDKTVSQAGSKVYYVPGSSYAYHISRNCRTLKRSRTVKKVTVKKSEKDGT